MSFIIQQIRAILPIFLTLARPEAFGGKKGISGLEATNDSARRWEKIQNYSNPCCFMLHDLCVDQDQHAALLDKT